MQLDKLIVETRVRSGWSAIDLGIKFARSFWLRAVLLYLTLAIPVFCLALLLGGNSEFLTVLILWWLKPVFERPILYMVSRELFSEPMSFTRILKEALVWLKPSFFWIITWRRFSIYRGMTAPIMLLEQPTGSSYSARANVLGTKMSSEAMWLNVVLSHLESFLLFAFIAVIALFFPASSEIIYDYFVVDESNQLINIFYAGLYLLAIVIIAPFYVTAGFMLYISRRIELEGWDIEITFRNWMSDYRAPIEQANDHDGNLTEPEVQGDK